MKILGIDASLNSLGACLLDTTTNTTHYYLITESPTKKLQAYSNPHLTQFFYTSQSLIDKAADVRTIRDFISNLLDEIKPDRVFIESPALLKISRSSSSLMGLNYIIRIICLDHSIPYTLLAPLHIKKEMTGNTKATKDDMVNEWLKRDPVAGTISIRKRDDLADAYSLAFIGSQESQND